MLLRTSRKSAAMRYLYLARATTASTARARRSDNAGFHALSRWRVAMRKVRPRTNSCSYSATFCPSFGTDSIGTPCQQTSSTTSIAVPSPAGLHGLRRLPGQHDGRCRARHTRGLDRRGLGRGVRRCEPGRGTRRAPAGRQGAHARRRRHVMGDRRDGVGGRAGRRHPQPLPGRARQLHRRDGPGEQYGQYGPLAVAPAGNEGPQPGTIPMLGTASSALTVAAVRDDDRVAGFSSAGPAAVSGCSKVSVSAASG